MIIKNLKRLDKGPLSCTFSIVLPKWANFVIHNMSLFESNGKRWINFPGNSYEKDGKKKFFQYCAFEDPKHKEAFQQAVMAVLDEELAKTSVHTQQSKEPSQEELPF